MAVHRSPLIRLRTLGIIVALVLPLSWMSLHSPQLAHASVVAPAPNLIASGENIWYDTSGNRINAHSGYFVKSGSTYYWFGMVTGQSPFAGVNVYTSTDLVNWTFDKIALSPQGAGDVSGLYAAYRPAVIYNSSTSKWVMYLDLCAPGFGPCANSTQKYGVATSSALDGPYTYIGSSLVGTYTGDLSLYEDTAGNGYLLSDTSDSNLTIYNLSSDYLSISSTAYTFSTACEAPAMFQRNGRFYLICSNLNGWGPDTMYYSTATSITGPWTSLTPLFPNSSDGYSSQSGGIITVAGTQETSYVYVGDRWLQGGQANPDEAKYVWLPLRFDDRSNSMSIPAFDDVWSINTSTGEWATPDTVPSSSAGTGTNQWQLSGSGWIAGTAPAGRGDYLGQNQYSVHAGDYATLTVNGTGIDLYGIVGPNFGIGTVSVDGAAPTTVDYYAAAGRGDQLVYSKQGLSPGSHTLVLTVTGTKDASSSGYFVAFDRTQVTAVEYNDNASQFSYGAGWAYGGETDHAGRYQADNHYTATLGSVITASLTFTGTGADLYGSVGPLFAEGTVAIDGGTATAIDECFTGPITHGNQLIYRSPTVAEGVHTLTITATGTEDCGSSSDVYFAVDRAVIRS